MSQNSQTIIIIGGGQAAGWAVKTLREQGHTGPLLVVSDEPYDFYERPPLSKAVLLDPSPQLPRLFSEQEIANWQIDWHRPATALAIDAKQQTVSLNNGDVLAYDQLLIATGGQARMPAAWRNQPRVLALRSWQDALNLKQQLKNCRRLAIIGGGWIGLEIAASARQLASEVTIFECQPRLCQRSVAEPVSQMLSALHQQQGVQLLCDCGEISLEATTAEVWVGCRKQPPQPFDLVVVGIGVELNLAIAQTANLQIKQGIIVDGQGRTSDNNIFAAGDVACHASLGICLQSWAYAQNQAIATAKAMLDEQAADYQEIPWFWSDQYQNNIQILGIPAAGQAYQRITPQAQLYFTLSPTGQLLQLVAVNDSRTIKLAKRWMQKAVCLDPNQLTDVDYPLMSLK